MFRLSFVILLSYEYLIASYMPFSTLRDGELSGAEPDSHRISFDHPARVIDIGDPMEEVEAVAGIFQDHSPSGSLEVLGFCSGGGFECRSHFHIRVSLS